MSKISAMNVVTASLNKFSERLLSNKKTFKPFRLLILIVIFQAIATFAATCAFYKFYSVKANLIVKECTAELVDDLSRTFNLTNEFLNFIGKQIVKGNYRDLGYIHSILKDVKLGDHRLNPNAFSWSHVDWINDKGFQLVNQHQGISLNSKDTSNRSYIEGGKNHPWKLQYSKPAIGHTSGVYVIPAGVGITDASNKIIGYLSVGFDINKLTEIIVMSLPQDISFQVDDNSGSLIFSNLQSDIQEIADRKYINSSVVPNTPYIVSTFINQGTVHQSFVRYGLIVLSVNIITFVIAYFAIHHVKNRVIEIARRAEIASEELNRRINNYISVNVDKISGAGQELLNLDDDNLHDKQVNYSKKMLHLASIINATDNINYPSPHPDNYYYVNLHNVIGGLLDTLGNKLLEKNINLRTSLSKDVSYIVTDDLCIRLLLAGLFSYTTDNLRLNGELIVKTSSELYSGKKHVRIEITGNGLELDPYIMDRIKNNQLDGSNYSNNYRSLWYLIKLAESMGCVCAAAPIHKTMSSIKILVPEELERVSDSGLQDVDDKKSNVIYMKPKD